MTKGRKKPANPTKPYFKRWWFIPVPKAKG